MWSLQPPWGEEEALELGQEGSPQGQAGMGSHGKGRVGWGRLEQSYIPQPFRSCPMAPHPPGTWDAPWLCSPQAPSRPPGHSRPLHHKSRPRQFPANPERLGRVAPATQHRGQAGHGGQSVPTAGPVGRFPLWPAWGRGGGDNAHTCPPPGVVRSRWLPQCRSRTSPVPVAPPARSRPGVRSSLWCRSGPHGSPRSRGDPRGSSPSRCRPLPAAPPGPIPLHAALPDPARSRHSPPGSHGSGPDPIPWHPRSVPCLGLGRPPRRSSLPVRSGRVPAAPLAPGPDPAPVPAAPPGPGGGGVCAPAGR